MEKIVQDIIDIFNHPSFSIFGGIVTIVIVFSLVYTFILVIKGIIPVLYRIGIGLAKRKIAVFATYEYANLKGMLVDSCLFTQKNITQIDRESIKKAESSTLMLVHWESYKDKIDDILSIKRDHDALIVYAPKKEGDIDEINITKINSERNAIIVNFRGRLLNDIFTSMITSGYEKEKNHRKS